MIERPVLRLVSKVLDYGKMAFVSGPRQVGKTTLAEEARKAFPQSLSFNWDVISDQKRLLREPFFFEGVDRDPRRPFLVVFDEIHKYARWRNYLKGAWDRFHAEFRFLVTGSGHLELFKKGGDSLLGRYLSVPLYPLTVGELCGGLPSWEEFKRGLSDLPAPGPEASEAYLSLWRLSGFPEPFVRGEEAFYNVWFQERKSLLIREDIQTTSPVRQLSLLEMLSHIVPERVGSPLSINSLREDVGVAFETARDWIFLLEMFFYLFRISPFAGSGARSLRKEAKTYLYDWVEVAEEGPRFENVVALHLLKAVRTWRAMGAGDIGLNYVRDKEKREVDFLITERRRPVCLVECKASETDLSASLSYYQRRLRAPAAVQLVHRGGVCRKTVRDGGVFWIVSADRWLRLLP